MENPVIIFGANGIGKSALEIFQNNGVITYGFLDDNKDLHGKTINDISVMGSTGDDGFLKLIGHKCEAFVAIDNIAERRAIVKMLNDRRKMMPVNAIHPGAKISGSAIFGHGNFINHSVTIGTEVKIGNHNIIHSGAIINFEAIIGNFTQVGAGAIISAGVKIGDDVFIGSGAVLVPGIKIGNKARVGAGSVVIADIKEGETVFGNPAKSMEI